MNGIKVTREMVAQRAGVCKQTVSCYLNKTRGVSKESADKIEAAIGELNYVSQRTFAKKDDVACDHLR